jgi:hypothetical protein
MNTSATVREQIVEKYRKENPKIDVALVERIVDDVTASMGKAAADAGLPRADNPFAVSWMDSYLAHWILGQQVAPELDRNKDLAPVVRDLLDARFAERLDAIRKWIDRVAEPPDGGVPEPGVPPVGPSAVLLPDGGTPEPGVPPVGPSQEPPDGGPPEPGVPPVGPAAVSLGDNPWILYWFVSLKLPLLVDVMDAHIERRLSELGFR